MKSPVKLSENKPVSVSFLYDHKSKKSYPQVVYVDNNIYRIKNIGFHHHYSIGSTLYHVFSASTDGLFLKLLFNTKSLNWFLEEFYDAESD